MSTCATCGTQNLVKATHCQKCGTPLQQLLYSLPPGTTLQQGKYRIDKILGEGGFGITYQAQSDRGVIALKELFPRGSARNQDHSPILPGGRTQDWFERNRDQFLSEIRLLMPLQHPNIVKVYDCFRENNTAYMVMEMVKGRTLGSLSKARGPLAPQEALRYLLQTAMALDILHRQNLVHRDVKSENIIVDEKQRAVLIDFGSVQPTAEEVADTQFSVVSSGFSPPELYSFQSHYGPSVDIYALAAVAYHLLTTQVPTPAPERQKGYPIESVRTFNKLVPIPFEQAVLQGLALDASQRPNSALGLIRGLINLDQATAQFTPSSSVVPSKGTRTQTFSIPKKVTPSLTRSAQLLETLEGHSSGVVALSFSPDGRLLASCSAKRVRFWEVASNRKLFTLEEAHINSLGFRAEGVFLGDRFGGLRVWQMGSGQMTMAAPPLPKPGYETEAFQGELSADGKWWAALSPSTQEITLWNTQTGRQARKFVPSNEEINSQIQSLALSSDGEYLAVARKDGKVKVWRAGTGETLGWRNNYQHAVKYLVFDPQVQHLLCTDTQGGTLVWDWQKGHEQLLQSHGPAATGLAFHSQKRMLGVFFGVAPFWQFWNLTLQQSPQMILLKDQPPSAIRTFAFHPLEAILATGHTDGQIRLWQIS